MARTSKNLGSRKSSSPQTSIVRTCEDHWATIANRRLDDGGKRRVFKSVACAPSKRISTPRKRERAEATRSASQLL